jgi:uncharacterized protein (DUF3820 family)
MMAGRQPERVGLDAKILRRIENSAGNYVLEELTLQTLPGRRAHVWLARPAQPKGKVGAVLAITGHCGSGEQVIRGSGAVRQGGWVYLILTSDGAWEGRVVFDRPRHTLLMHLPFDYPRINQFPEWFTVDAAAQYEVKIGGGPQQAKSGVQLAEGIPVKLQAGETLLMEARKMAAQ